MREVGSVSFVCSTTLPEPGKGETGDLGIVTKRLALIALRGASLLEVWCRIWREEGRWSLLQWTLGEFEKLSSLNETKSLPSIFGCEEKTEISNFQELIGRPHQLFVSINVWCQDFWNLILSNFVKFNFEKMLPLEYSSSIIHLSINPDAKYLKCKTREIAH